MIKLCKRLLKFIINTYIKLTWLIKPNKNNLDVCSYSICIVTYCKRFDTNFKPLIKKLCTIYPTSEIIVGVNGYYDQNIQQDFLKEFTLFVSRYKNIKWFKYDYGQSLSKMWNQCIINSSNDKVLILNDDVLITKCFRKQLDNIDSKFNNCITILNGSWSHFFITKKIIDYVGWFDERLPGVGNEDWDYEIRSIIKNIPVLSISTNSIVNLVIITKDFSYSKNEITINTKYSNSNWEFFKSKWHISDTAEIGFTRTRFKEIPYVKLKDGMDTPNFYN